MTCSLINTLKKMGSTENLPSPLTQPNILGPSQAPTYNGHTAPCPPPLSAPIGHILAEVRAIAPTHSRLQPVYAPFRAGQAQGDSPATAKSFRPTLSSFTSVAMVNKKGSTMTRGNGVKKPTRMDTLSWWSSVKVGERKDGSSDSVGEGRSISRVSSLSRRDVKSNPEEKIGSRTDSKVKADDEAKENDVGQSLQDE
jgi:WD repeat-containing protein 59